MLKIFYFLSFIQLSLSTQCQCLLGYRNGASSNDENLCMGPSEGGNRPCYPTPCNADWTACTTSSSVSSSNTIWEKDTTNTGKRPDCPFVGIRQDGANYAWNTLDICKKNNVKTCSVVNSVESTIARNSDWVLPIHAGPEIGVASTKAFLGQMLVLYILCLKLAQSRKDINDTIYQNNIKNLKALPDAIKKSLKVENSIQAMAKEFLDAKGSMFLGRGLSFPIALEGALKLKELSYLHAEGYPAGEMKHGPLA